MTLTVVPRVYGTRRTPRCPCGAGDVRTACYSPWCRIDTMSDKRTSIRLPDELHERVRQVAERDRRSVHAELLWLIERGLEEADQDQEGSR